MPFIKCQPYGTAVMPSTRYPFIRSSLCWLLRPRPAGTLVSEPIHLAPVRVAGVTGPSHLQEGAGLGLDCLLQLTRPLAPPGPLRHLRHLWASPGPGAELFTRGKASLAHPLGLQLGWNCSPSGKGLQEMTGELGTGK